MGGSRSTRERIESMCRKQVALAQEGQGSASVGSEQKTHWHSRPGLGVRGGAYGGNTAASLQSFNPPLFLI